MKDHDEIKNLILQAFGSAHRSGKPNWNEMTTAVLKNRLLTLTLGRFRETDYGAVAIHQIIEWFPDHFLLDRSSRPALVKLISGDTDTLPFPFALPTNTSADGASPTEPSQVTVSKSVVSRGRIRPDLWRAVLDFRSGSAYVWDADTGKAIKAEEPFILPRLPAISKSEFDQLKIGFVSKVKAILNPNEALLLEKWGETQSVRTKTLPLILQAQWFEHLKEEVIRRLGAWFKEKGLEMPNDALANHAPSRRQVEEPEVEQLRKLVIECIKGMTLGELSEIRLSPVAVLRSQIATKK